MTPSRHPLPETLISYAAGTLPSAHTWIVAHHISTCQKCFEDARRLEIIGGVMLDSVEPIAVHNADADHILAGKHAEAKKLDSSAPQHLLAGADKNQSDISWKTDGTGAQYYWIDLPKAKDRIRVIRLMPGQRLLDHIAAEEISLGLVQEGACRDETGEYKPGDVIEWTDEERRNPVPVRDIPCIIAIARNPQDTADIHYLSSSVKSRQNKALSWHRFGSGNAWTPAIAASLAIIAGLGLGWLIHRGLSDTGAGLDEFFLIEDNRLIAQGPLRLALDNSPSGEAISNSDDMRLTLRMSFQSQAGDYCREYFIASSSAEGSAGVACHQSGQWVVHFQALVPPPGLQTDEIKPAGADSLIYPLIETIIDGPPLGADDEARLIAKRWAK